MRPRMRSTAFLLVLLVLTAGLVAGCGGGESGGSPDDGGGGNGQQGQANREAPETKVALGTVARVNSENERRIAVRPRTQGQEQQGDPLVFKVRKNANVTLDGRPAEVGDVSEGQQAQVEYVVKNDLNRAVSVQLFEAEGQQD